MKKVIATQTIPIGTFSGKNQIQQIPPGTFHSDTWSKPAKKPKQNHGIVDYSHGIKKQNTKDKSTGIYGEHKWYDPRSGKMGAAGPDYPGSKRKPR
jgi:hypothetical protein